MAETVRLAGIRELNAALKQVDTDLPKGVRLALNAATETLAGRIRPLVPSVSGRARASIKARSTRTAARLSVGGARAPYYPWLDFGGTAPRAGTRPFRKDGRYIYASYFKHRDELAVNLEAALLEAARSAGVEVD